MKLLEACRASDCGLAYIKNQNKEIAFGDSEGFYCSLDGSRKVAKKYLSTPNNHYKHSDLRINYNTQWEPVFKERIADVCSAIVESVVKDSNVVDLSTKELTTSMTYFEQWLGVKSKTMKKFFEMGMPHIKRPQGDTPYFYWDIPVDAARKWLEENHGDRFKNIFKPSGVPQP
jgi:hypothetical protein